MSIETTNVVEIPIKRVTPTVRIGFIGTSSGQVSTLKPIIVVRAERKMAFPVVIAALTVAVRLISGSNGSTSIGSPPSLAAAHASSFIFSIISVRFSSILFVRWSE